MQCQDYRQGQIGCCFVCVSYHRCAVCEEEKLIMVLFLVSKFAFTYCSRKISIEF